MYKKYFKRSIDFIITLFGFICISPLFLVLCLLVKQKLGSPIFFKQVRIGIDEKPFKMIKFRTMLDSRDENGNLLPDTDRFAKFGDFLRNSSLDELPELINVIKGDMSLIGPRPLLVQYLPLYSEKQKHRHDVRPGLSGYAQVNGRNSISWTHKFELDCEYVEKITFLGDLKILFQTIGKAFLKQEGISSDTSDTMEDFDGTN